MAAVRDSSGKTIDDYKREYAQASARGDAAGMRAANDAANAIRASQGQTAQVASQDIARVERQSGTGTAGRAQSTAGNGRTADTVGALYESNVGGTRLLYDKSGRVYAAGSDQIRQARQSGDVLDAVRSGSMTAIGNVNDYAGDQYRAQLARLQSQDPNAKLNGYLSGVGSNDLNSAYTGAGSTYYATDYGRTIQQAKEDWNAAKTRYDRAAAAGDSAGMQAAQQDMDAAHRMAETARQINGYSGGEDGSQKINMALTPGGERYMLPGIYEEGERDRYLEEMHAYLNGGGLYGNGIQNNLDTHTGVNDANGAALTILDRKRLNEGVSGTATINGDTYYVLSEKDANGNTLYLNPTTGKIYSSVQDSSGRRRLVQSGQQDALFQLYPGGSTSAAVTPSVSGGTGSTGSLNAWGSASGTAGTGGSTSGSVSTGVNDYSNYLEEMYAAQRRAAIAQLNSAYQQNINAIDRAGQGIDEQYQSARNQAAGASELAARNFAEYAAASGLNSGAGGQAELARNVALQNSLGEIDTAQAGTLAELELQRANAETEYNSAIAQAQANSDYALAAALYEEKVRVENALIEQQYRQWQMNLQQEQLAYQAQRDAVSDQQWQQSFDYQTQRDALSSQSSRQETLASYGNAFLEMGLMPSQEMLDAMGITAADAQRYLNRVNGAAIQSTAGSTAGRSTAGRSSSAVQSAAASVPATGQETDEWAGIDTNSVSALGYGPISRTQLETLVDSGAVEAYQDPATGLIRFRRVSGEGLAFPGTGGVKRLF